MREHWSRGGGRPRPPWWPEGEAWPPAGPPGPQMWRRYRGRFLGRAVAALITLFVLTVGGCTLAFWLVTAAVGQLEQPASLTVTATVAGIALMVLGLLFVMFTASAMRRLTAPVDDFMEAVGRVADGNFETRVEERGAREMRRLARAFNTMAARLKASEAQRRGLLADVTHELRTPLTVIQGGLEGVLDGVYAADEAHLRPILDETRVLARLIDDLRTLAEAESGTLALHREPTDLGVLCGETVAAYRPQAQAAGVTLSLDASDEMPVVNVDPVRIREVVSNLIANALRYTGEGGRVSVSVRMGTEGNGGNKGNRGNQGTQGTQGTWVEGNRENAGNQADRAIQGDEGDGLNGEGMVVIEVADTGAGIGAEALPHIFERFYKGPDSRGSGLGLAIAKDLVEAHGGRIEAKSEVGQGTTVVVTLET